MEKRGKAGMVAKIEDLQSLLVLLREQGVQEYKTDNLSIVFSERAALKNPLIETIEEKQINTGEVDEETLFYSGK